MPGLVSTLLNHAYSMPLREVHTFLQVTEQVWQPMHLSRFSTITIWPRIFIGLLHSRQLDVKFSFARLTLLPVHPIDLVHFAHDDEAVTVVADRTVVIEAP